MEVGTDCLDNEIMMYASWAARSGCGVLRKQVFESNRSVPLVPSESGDPETEILLW